MEKMILKNHVAKILLKFISTCLLIFVFNALLNRFTFHVNDETGFRFEKISIDNLKRIKRDPEISPAVFLMIRAKKKSNRITNWRSIIIPIIITTFFLSAALSEVNMKHHRKNVSGLLRINQSRIKESYRQALGIPIEKLIMRERGYDGQLFYIISFDPFLKTFENPKDYKELIDAPVYRYSRIGFPLLINMFSLGNKEIFPEIMLLLIIFSHLFAAYYRIL